jgi:hypothetical protein
LTLLIGRNYTKLSVGRYSRRTLAHWRFPTLENQFMHRPFRPLGVSMVLWAALSSVAGLAAAAQPAAKAPAKAPAKAAATSVTTAGRKLAPGVLESVEPQRNLEETVSRHDLVEILAANSKLDWAKDLAFRRDVWFLDFHFKSPRFVEVDIPQRGGRLERRKIFYVVYCVTNPGKIAHPIPNGADGTVKMEFVDRPVRFVPMFLFTSLEDTKFSYPDRVIPLAKDAIRRREDTKQTFYNTVEIANKDIGVGQTLWGYATWIEGDVSRGVIPADEIDPRIDRFSIYVTGLTNAYQWQDDKAAMKQGMTVGKGRELTRKTLKLNFWRPGDEYDLREEEFRFGIPGEVDYEWVYR